MRVREKEQDRYVRLLPGLLALPARCAKPLLAGAATLASIGIPAAAQEMPPPSRPVAPLAADLNFLLGQKYLDRDDWGPRLDEQFATGLETTWRRPGWHVGVALDAVFANAEKRTNEFTAEEVELRGSTLEVALGARAVIPVPGKRVRPYLGAGAEIAQGDVQVIRRGGADDAHGGGATGWWAGAGVYLRLGQTANVGLTARWSTAEVDASGFHADAGGMTYAVLIGFGIPPFGDDP